MKKYGWMVAGLLLTVVGCQRREMMYLGDSAPIHFSVAYQDAAVAAESAYSSQAPQTKALVNLPKDVTVRVLAFQRRIVSGNPAPQPDPQYDVLKAECTYKADGNGGLVPCAVDAEGKIDASGTVPEGISLNNGTYDFYAYSPARKIESNNFQVKGVDHGMDWLGTVLANKSVSKAASTVKLEFEHKCSKLTFNIKQPAGADVSKMTVDSIVIRKMNTKANVDPYWINKDLLIGMGGTTDTCLFKGFVALNDNSTPAKLIGRTGGGLVLPKSADKVPAEIYLTYHPSDGTKDTSYLFKTELPSVEYKKGLHYVYNMNVKKTIIEFKLNVLSWDKVSIDLSGGIGGDNLDGVLVGSWFEHVSSPDMGDDNVDSGQIGGWKPVNSSGQIGDSANGGTDNPDGDVGNWGNVNNGTQTGDGANGGTANPGGNTGSWGGVNDNQPSVGQ